MKQKEILHNGTFLYIDELHRFGTDAMLLSYFCNIKRKETAIDLCSGCGILAFRFIDSGATGNIDAVEIQIEAAELITTAKNEQKLTNLFVHCQDLSGFRCEKPVDLVACNPPYFTSGSKAQVEGRATARHESDGLLRSIIMTASANLKDRGRLCLCHRPERLADIFCLMREYNIEPKRLQLVRPKKGRAHYLALIDGRKNGGVGLHILPEITVENANGEHTAEVVKIYKGG